MSKLNQITANEQLFAELTPEQGANVSGGATLLMYRDNNFLGGRIKTNGNIKNFVSLGFNDVVSSLKVTGGTFTLYQDINFGGYSVTVSSKGGPNNDGVYPNANWLGGRNDQFSSVRLNSNNG